MGKTRTKRHIQKTMQKRKKGKCGRKSRKYKGGVSFNGLSGNPGQYTYPQNMYETQLNRVPMMVDARLQTGLPYQFAGKKGKKRQRKTCRKKMKGGLNLTGTDLLTGNTSQSNAVFAFGESGGTKFLLNEMNGTTQPSGPYLAPDKIWSSIV